VKENITEDLVGVSANPAKSEYQANIDEIRFLKKEFFKVGVLTFNYLGQSSRRGVKYVCDVLSWLRDQQNLPEPLLQPAIPHHRNPMLPCIFIRRFVRYLGEGGEHLDGC